MSKYRTLLAAVGLSLLIATPGFSAGAGQNISGKVLDTMNSGGYTYVQLQTAKETLWAAVPKASVQKGQDITIMPGAEMRNFSSKTLNKTFDSILFSSGIVGGSQLVTAKKSDDGQAAGSFAAALESEVQANGENRSGHGGSPAGGMGSSMMAGSGTDPQAGTSGSSGAVVPSTEVKVKKAEGMNAYTVGEVFAKAAELDNKSVKIRGKVLKISRMIMGKNWLHIQDGTGDAMNNSHDLVVTTSAEPAKGAVIIIEGVLHKDRDFGFGYHYNVIVEDAKIVKK